VKHVHPALGVLGAAFVLATAACSEDGQTGGFEQISGSSGAGAGGSSSSGNNSSSSGNNSTSTGPTDPPKLGPPYPIVLAHGFFGFEDFAGAGFLTYYYGVKEHLAQQGETQVFTPAVDPFNSSEYRGAQLASEIQEILETTGHAKVNIIGHSQGGLDARVVAHDYPSLVASVVTLQTPHLGTPIADVALKVIDDGNLQGVLDFLLQAVGRPLYNQVDDATTLYAPLYDFSSQGIAEFNAKYPDARDIYYASVAGRSDWHYGGSVCNVSGPSFINEWDSELDPIDPMFDLMEMMLDGGIGNPYPNDGLVRAKDARWGDFLGCLPADHMDMVGQLLGDNPGPGNSWDYKQFYLDIVGFLRAKGY
jgi:triacylglycerol lipase